jgi:hypothetical protein
MTIQWGRSDNGYVESKCGRFSIHALCMGTTRPQGYELWANGHGRIADADTQAQAKREAEEWLKRTVTIGTECDGTRGILRLTRESSCR